MNDAHVSPPSAPRRTFWQWFLGKGQPETEMPPWIFFVQLAWLLLLFAVFIVYVTSSAVRDALPNSFGKIPIEAPWFGALGACIKSFTGIFDHNHGSWSRSYNYWHAVRPLIGAATGGAGCVLLLMTLEAASKTNIQTDAITFDAAAFIFGYGEGAFRRFVKKATELIEPGGTSSGDRAKSAAGEGPRESSS